MMHDKMMPPFTKKDGAKRPKAMPGMKPKGKLAKKAMPMKPEHEILGEQIMKRAGERKW